MYNYCGRRQFTCAPNQNVDLSFLFPSLCVVGYNSVFSETDHWIGHKFHVLVIEDWVIIVQDQRSLASKVVVRSELFSDNGILDLSVEVSPCELNGLFLPPSPGSKDVPTQQLALRRQSVTDINSQSQSSQMRLGNHCEAL